MRSDGSGRSPGRRSTMSISRRSRSNSDMGCLLSMQPHGPSAFEQESGRRVRPNHLLLPQLYVEFRRLSAGNGHRQFDGTSVGLNGYELVIAGGHVGDRELAIGAGYGVVGIVYNVDPAFHPPVRIAVDSHGARSLQLGRNPLALVGQRHIEGGALS